MSKIKETIREQKEELGAWGFDNNCGNHALYVKDVKKLLDRYTEALLHAFFEDIPKFQEKKFPLGEREWCIECAERMDVELREQFNKLMKEVVVIHSYKQ